MKYSIRKFGLFSLVPAMALAALFTACGEDGKNGVDGAAGEQGTAGESCSAKALVDGSGYTLICGDKEVGVIKNGTEGVKGKDGVGKDGEGCEISRNGYELTITCANSTEVVDLRDFVVQSSSSEGDETDKPAEVMSNNYYSVKENCPEGLECKYATATTEYLNQEMLADNKYGEILDTRDGQVYKTIEICDKGNENCQTWMAQNLNYAPKPDRVAEIGTNAWSGCYGDKSTNCDTYGRLYTWAVAMDNADCAFDRCRPSGIVQGVCPAGWHLPTIEELQKLVEPMATSVDDHTYDFKYFGAEVKLKSEKGWPSTTGTNASGFSALPAGYRTKGGEFFSQSVDYVNFFSAEEYFQIEAFGLYLMGDDYDYAGLDRFSKSSAYSVRCVQTK